MLRTGGTMRPDPRLAVAVVLAALAGPGCAPVAEARVRPVACVSADRDFRCPVGRAMENPDSLAVAPDGRWLVVPSGAFGTAAVLRVTPRTGAMRQSRGRRGCLAGNRVPLEDAPYARTCTRVRGVAETVQDLSVSPDGRHLYIVSAPSEAPSAGLTGLSPGVQAVAVLRRGRGGGFRQRPGSTGCVANRRLDRCAVRRSLRATEIAVSPDGRHVYLAGSSTLTVMRRDSRTGTLTWRSCLATGAVVGCSPLPSGIRYPGVPAFTSDGRIGYLLTPQVRRDGLAGVIVTLRRDPSTGDLAALAAPTGCLSSAPFRDCTVDGRLNDNPAGLLLAPGDRDVYITSVPFTYIEPLASDVPFAIVGFRRDVITGTLSAANAMCLSRLARLGCTVEAGVAQVRDLAITPDGRRVFATRGDEILRLVRDPQTATLQPVGALAGCGFLSPCDSGVSRNTPRDIEMAPSGRYFYAVSHSFFSTGTVAAFTTR